MAEDSDHQASSQSQPAITAANLTAHGDEGRVFGPLSFTVTNKGLTNLVGAEGSGRTALILILTGRMQPSQGSLIVLGETSHRKISLRTALSGVDQIDFLERSVTVSDILTETLAWRSPWFRPLSQAGADELQQMCGWIYGERDLPPLDAYVSQIPSLDRLLLRLCMAFYPAHKNDVELLVMDDIGQVRSNEDREILLNILFRIAQTIPVLVTSVNPIDSPQRPCDVIYLDTAHADAENRDVPRERKDA